MDVITELKSEQLSQKHKETQPIQYFSNRITVDDHQVGRPWAYRGAWRISSKLQVQFQKEGWGKF